MENSKILIYPSHKIEKERVMENSILFLESFPYLVSKVRIESL